MQAIYLVVSHPPTFPVPKQQVAEPLDLFVVHAAHACVLHPGCGYGTVLSAGGAGGGGGLHWWGGGNPEEASLPVSNDIGGPYDENWF